MWFELLGLGTVAVGLAQTTASFRLRSRWTQGVHEWLGRRPRFRRHLTVHGSAAISIGGATVTGIGKVFAGTVTTSLESQVAALTQRVADMETRARDSESRLEKQALKHGEALEAERLARKSADVDIDARLEKAIAGGVVIEIMGVAWLLIGILLASASVEIVSLFGLH